VKRSEKEICSPFFMIGSIYGKALIRKHKCRLEEKERDGR
jgi:hypothetical protein